MPKKNWYFGLYLENVDIFGKRVYLTHRNRETHKTQVGGLISIVFAIVMFVYLFNALADMWNDKISNIVIDTSYHPTYDNSYNL